MFSLHPQLDADTIPLSDFTLSSVLLMDYCELPWLILVPRRENVSEWFQLQTNDQRQLHFESMALSKMLMNLFQGDKLNTGALGNLVPQLHVHHIVRFKHDSIWPNPVWGAAKPSPYDESSKREMVAKLQCALKQRCSDLYS